MSRRRRVDFEGAIHHVMNRGVDRQTVFFDDADRVEFGRRLASIHRDFGVETLAYCLMDNHYHLLLHTPAAALSAAMQQLGSLYTRHTNDRVGRDGPIFRGRFHAIPVTDAPYLAWAARYIHRNPIAIPGVHSPSAYRWSSYRAYLGLRKCPAFLRPDPVLSLFDHDIQRLTDVTEDPGATYGTGRPTRDVLIDMVRLAVAENDIRCNTTDAESRVLDRTLLLKAADELGCPRLMAAVHEHLGAPSPTARRMSLHRARARCSDDPAVQDILRRVLDQFAQRPRAA